MSGPADPVVRLYDPCEPFSWSWEGPLSAFLADNAETIGPEEAESIRATLAAGDLYEGGGGAEPEWQVGALEPQP